MIKKNECDETSKKWTVFAYKEQTIYNGQICTIMKNNIVPFCFSLSQFLFSISKKTAKQIKTFDHYKNLA